MSNLWNSDQFNPVAAPSDCHSDFVLPIDCSYTHVAGLAPATPQKIADCLASMKSDLLRIISRWEQSGQGEGGRENEDNEDNEGYNNENGDTPSPRIRRQSSSSAADGSDVNNTIILGSLSARPARALHSRQSFLNGRPSYLLYYWELADRLQILQSSLQRLTSAAGAADASTAPSTVTTSNNGGNRARRRDDDREEHPQQGTLVIPLAASIDKLTAAHERMSEERVKDREQEKQLEEARLLLSERDNERKRKFARQSELRDLARKYRRERAELDMNDPRTASLMEFYNNECAVLETELAELGGSNN
jgi:hypothetical protein